MYRTDMNKNNTKRILWSIRVPKHLNDSLDRYIDEDSFQTKSEFIRTAVRDRLREERKRMKEENLARVPAG